VALSPEIPTSFVPKQPVRPAARRERTGGNAFLFFSLFVLGAAILGTVGTFFYDQYLLKVRDAKAIDLEQAKNNIDLVTVEEFIRLRDRFTAADTLLDSHITLSPFFSALEGLTLQAVRFKSLAYSLVEEGKGARIEMGGVAQSFNALAAQSAKLSEERRIKRAIFSGITVNDDYSVSFLLTADLYPSLIVGSMPVAVQTEGGVDIEETSTTTSETIDSTETTETNAAQGGTHSTATTTP
jgi:hypothetical protein